MLSPCKNNLNECWKNCNAGRQMDICTLTFTIRLKIFYQLHWNLWQYNMILFSKVLDSFWFVFPKFIYLPAIIIVKGKVGYIVSDICFDQFTFKSRIQKLSRLFCSTRIYDYVHHHHLKLHFSTLTFNVQQNVCKHVSNHGKGKKCNTIPKIIAVKRITWYLVCVYL